MRTSQHLTTSLKISLVLFLLGVWADGSGELRHRDAVASDSTQTSAIDGISITPDNQILVELMPEDTTPANLFDLNGRTLVFTPDGSGPSIRGRSRPLSGKRTSARRSWMEP